MDAKRKIPILAYAMAVLVAVSTLLLGALAAYDQAREDRRLSSELELKLQRTAERMALGMVLPTWNFDFEQVDGLISSILADPDIRGIWIALDDNKKTQFIHGRGEDGRPSKLSAPPQAEGGLVVTRDIMHGGERLGRVSLYGSTGPIKAFLARELRRRLLAILFLDLALVAALYALFYRAILQPLKRIEDYTRAVAAGEAGAALELQSEVAEIDGLAASLRAMVGLLAQRYEELQASEARQREAQRLESVGQLAGGVAHDFNNILQVVATCAELARQSLSPGHPALMELEAILESGAKGSRLVRQLLQFSRRQVVEPRVLRLESLVRGMADLVGRLLGEGVRLETRFQPGVGPVRVDPGQFEQLLMNLCINARDAVGANGRISIEISETQLHAGQQESRPAAEGPYVVLSVSDNGAGIAPEVLPHIFEPFFSTKPQSKGSGLGLATCFGIVAQCGGFITVESAQGQGSSFRVWLPRAEMPAQEAPAPLGAVPAAPSQGGERLLLTEDDAIIRRALERLLRAQGYQVLSAAGPEEGLLQAEGQVPDLVISDLVMPGMSGQDYARRLRAKHPRMRFLFMSGYSENLAGQELVLEPGDAFLPKPFASGELFLKIRQILDQPRGPLFKD
jgi:signal transduction histidine kinase